jgi:hypothetical protein
MKPGELIRLKERLRPEADRLQLRGTDLESFRAVLEKFRERPVYVIPFTLGAGFVGLWLDTDTADYIFYELNTTPFHQRHIVLHEGSHILRGHGGVDIPELVSSLPLRLDPTMIRSLLGRSAYTEQEEAEAEVLATLIEEDMELSAPPRIKTGEQTAHRIARFIRETR